MVLPCTIMVQKKLGRFFIIKYFFLAKPNFTPTPVSNAWAQHCLYPLYKGWYANRKMKNQLVITGQNWTN